MLQTAEDGCLQRRRLRNCDKFILIIFDILLTNVDHCMIKLLLFSRIMTVPGAGDSERILSGVKRVILVLSGEESLILFTKYSNLYK